MTAAAHPVIGAHGLTKIYGEGDVAVRALADVTLDIEAGDFVALSGPSGSGKSTLLNMLGLLEAPTAGQILIDGAPAPLDRPAELGRLRGQRLGFVFQQFSLVPVLSALENVELPLYETGLGKPERQARAAALLRDVGLGERLQNRPAQLSGGQQQRVAVARALIREPLIVLADEPTANLDSQTAEQLLELMLDINRRRGTAFIFATHDPRVLSRARRVVQLTDGRITS